MPSKNLIKTYLPDYYYHLYTRGVNKRKIFMDENDCVVFLRYLKLYLSPIEELKKMSDLDLRITKFIRNNLSEDIDLSCFALMPNHIHLLVKLHSIKGAELLMRRVLTAYAMYFNSKYKRVGHLFQSRYKAAVVLSDEYLLYLTRYIHRNPVKLSEPAFFPKFTSYPYYLREKRASWIKPQEILTYFNEENANLSYKSFMEDSANEIPLGELTLE